MKGSVLLFSALLVSTLLFGCLGRDPEPSRPYATRQMVLQQVDEPSTVQISSDGNYSFVPESMKVATVRDQRTNRKVAEVPLSDDGKASVDLPKGFYTIELPPGQSIYPNIYVNNTPK